MAGLITNDSAMIALRTLRTIGQGLERTQDEISTGKAVSTARDNAAVWAISKVMESDVKGFTEISDSLRLGTATLSVARSASEAVTKVLGTIKEKIVQANEDNIDRAKVQADFEGLRDQVSRIVSSAQFNGDTLLQNRTLVPRDGEVAFLGALNRLSSQDVTASRISVARRDLGLEASVVGATATTSGVALTLNAGDSAVVATYASSTISAGQSFDFDTAQLGGSGFVSYVARTGDSMADVTTQLAARINFDLVSNGVEDVQVGVTQGVSGRDSLIVENGSAAAITTTINIASEDLNGADLNGTIGGGLELLNAMDLSSATGAGAALAAIDWMVQVAVDAAAGFGSAQARLEKQEGFISKITDTLKSGIGVLIDADLEATSAKLQALQVQQQLGVQALSIANQAPSTLLSLFR